MKDKEHYRTIVKREPDDVEDPIHESVGYIDNVTHVTGANDREESEIYINTLYSLLLRLYSNKRLKINGSKTQFLALKNNKDDAREMKIKINDNEYIRESEKLKILGFIQNNRNSMDRHLNFTA